MSNNQLDTDILIIGSGIAGLSLAINLSQILNVVIVSKKNEWDSNTNYAQGGIASVLSSDDSFEKHINDTLDAGAGLCVEEIVKLVISNGPEAIDKLIKWGVDFTKENDGKLSLVREGGHSNNRIAHANDMTGRAIELALLAEIHKSERIRIFSNHTAIDLITEYQLKKTYQDELSCYGAYVLDNEKDTVFAINAAKTVICTGGIGQVYQHTTNPKIATGDGIAMAYRAGAIIENLEFMQFHPTALHVPGFKKERSFLISEAIRGFGGILRDDKGYAFMSDYDSRLELAPRDIVARAIDSEMKKKNLDSVFLDLSHKEANDIKEHFPNIYKKCLEYKLDITSEWIPVVPSAHYSCGGVKTDSEGRTEIKNLFACGEVSSTGLHGANRLASNSLLEAVVFAQQIFECIDSEVIRATKKLLPEWDDSGTINIEEWMIIDHDRKEIQALMWDYVGIVRSNFRLSRALKRINIIVTEVEAFYKRSKVFPELIELRNIALVAQLAIRCALNRKESRGLHYNIDYPIKKNTPKHTTLRSSRFKSC
jgi:L-aspartate oxidase